MFQTPPPYLVPYPRCHSSPHWRDVVGLGCLRLRRIDPLDRLQ